MDQEPLSSSDTDASLRGLLQESFDCLERDIPLAYQRMCALLEGLSVAVAMDDELIVIGCAGLRGRVDPAGGPVAAELRTSRRAILAVVDGRLSLADAVLTDAVMVKGSLDVLERLHRALEAYMHGAVRSRSFPALLARFRAPVQPASEGDAGAGRGRVRP